MFGICDSANSNSRSLSADIVTVSMFIYFVTFLYLTILTRIVADSDWSEDVLVLENLIKPTRIDIFLINSFQ